VTRTAAARLAELLAAHVGDADGRSAAAVARRAEVRALHSSAPFTTAADRIAAARILGDSDVTADVELAQSLALAAMAQDSAARPLAARAFDRLRVLAGRPQKFGTQPGHPVDPTTTDSERAKWGLPPLAELQRP
jgi:hypothetical protein